MTMALLQKEHPWDLHTPLQSIKYGGKVAHINEGSDMNKIRLKNA